MTAAHPSHRPTRPSRLPRRGEGRAFTLLELIVVIVILGILALLAIPTFLSVIDKSKTSVLDQNVEAVYRDSQAQAALGITGAATDALVRPAQTAVLAASTPTAANAAFSAVSAASEAMTATGPDGSDTVAAEAQGVVIWAQDSTGGEPATIEAYDEAWGLCEALAVSATTGAASPTACTAPAADPGSLTLMVVAAASDSSSGGTTTAAPIGVVAPYVPGGSSYTFGGGGAVSTPYATSTPGTSTPTSVTVTTTGGSSSSAPVTIATSGTTPDPGGTTVDVTVTGGSVQLAFGLTDATAAGDPEIYRCAGSSCAPDLSAPLATLAVGATSYTDTSVSAGDTYSYQVVVPDSYGSDLVSNIATVTIPASGSSPTTTAPTTTTPPTTTPVVSPATAAEDLLNQAAADEATFYQDHGTAGYECAGAPATDGSAATGMYLVDPSIEWGNSFGVAGAQLVYDNLGCGALLFTTAAASVTLETAGADGFWYWVDEGAGGVLSYTITVSGVQRPSAGDFVASWAAASAQGVRFF